MELFVFCVCGLDQLNSLLRAGNNSASLIWRLLRWCRFRECHFHGLGGTQLILAGQMPMLYFMAVLPGPTILADPCWHVRGQMSKSTLGTHKTPIRGTRGGVYHCSPTLKAIVVGLADTSVSLHFLHSVPWQDLWCLWWPELDGIDRNRHFRVEHHKSLSTTSCVLTFADIFCLVVPYFCWCCSARFGNQREARKKYI